MTKANLRERGTHVLSSVKGKTCQDGKGDRANKNSLSGAQREGRTNQDSERKTTRKENSPAVKRRQRNKVRKARQKQRHGEPSLRVSVGCRGRPDSGQQLKEASEGHLPTVERRGMDGSGQ